MFRKPVFLIAAMIACVGLARPASADVLVNGGFETGDFTGWTQFGNTGFSGVTGDVGGVAPHSGNYQAYFGPVGSLGGISQNAASGSYTLSFWLYNFGGTPSEVDVSAGGTTLLSATNPPASAYTQYSYPVTLTSPTMLSIQFAFQQNPSYFLLDDVSLTPTAAVPEPVGIISLLGIGGMGLVGLVWQRCRQKTAVSQAA